MARKAVYLGDAHPVLHGRVGVVTLDRDQRDPENQYYGTVWFRPYNLLGLFHRVCVPETDVVFLSDLSPLERRDICRR